ncbi:MAG: hypothetical protein P1P89_04665 [Desulfobacterales bacterium]|nr:hypothetical protein [Desulfobacterales bacterium]
MTYNFDPDKWYENELSILKSKFKSGEITEHDLKKAVNKLDKRHEDMWKRLDGTYQIPNASIKNGTEESPVFDCDR